MDARGQIVKPKNHHVRVATKRPNIVVDTQKSLFRVMRQEKVKKQEKRASDLADLERTPPKKKKQRIYHAESPAILRCNYVIGNFATHHVTVAMDSDFEFFPTVLLAPRGEQGVKLPHHAFKYLCDYMLYIDSYFNGENEGGQYINLGPDTSAELHTLDGYRVITFLYEEEEDSTYKRKVTINGHIWSCVYNMMGLLMNLCNQREAWAEEAQLLYEALLEHCKTRFSNEDPADLIYLEKYMNTLHLQELDYTPRSDCSMDVNRAFMEMKLFFLNRLVDSM